MGETRVDLMHLLEDLRDAYPGSLEETILTEILANAHPVNAAMRRNGMQTKTQNVTKATSHHKRRRPRKRFRPPSDCPVMHGRRSRLGCRCRSASRRARPM
jgi:hypothetical protein